jgi:transcription elongation GreA/GreB family factor
METSAELKSKSAEDIEEWFLNGISAKDIPVQELLAVLVFTHDSGNAEQADNLAGLLQDALAERAIVEPSMRLLELRSSWHEADAAFREVCRKAAAAVYSDRMGMTKVKSAFEANGVPLSECLRRLAVLVRLAPGVFCHENTWGFGVVKRLDDFYQKIIIDFVGKPEHPMSFAYAAETLDIVGEDHLMARRHKDPKAVADLIKNDPAEIVRIALRSYGSITAPRLKDILSPALMPEADWKPFWEAARKGLKNDPLVEIPSKRSDPIRLLARKKEYDEAWFVAFKAERDTDRLLELVEELDDAVAIKELSAEHRVALSERLAFVAKAGGSRRPELTACAVMTAARLDVAGADGDWTALTESLLVPDTFLRALNAMSSRDVERFLKHLGGINAQRVNDLLLSLLPRMPIVTLNEAMDFLVAGGKEKECAATMRPLTASRTAGMEILLWLSRHVDQMVAWGIARPAELLTQVVDAFAEDCGYAALKAQNGLRELMEQKSWLEDVLGRMDGRQRHDFLKKVIDAPGWEPSSRRSVMARVIKLYPELQQAVSGESEAEEQKKDSSKRRITSLRSYRDRQEALRKLVQEEVPKNSREIGVARSYGDLRENSEYKFAKEHQRLLMQRQAEMEQDLKEVVATDFNGFVVDKAGPGACVTVKRPDGRVDRYSILGEWDGDEARGIVSNMSQLAKVLEGHVVGDEVVLPGDDDKRPSQIVEISVLPDAVKQWIAG